MIPAAVVCVGTVAYTSNIGHLAGIFLIYAIECYLFAQRVIIGKQLTMVHFITCAVMPIFATFVYLLKVTFTARRIIQAQDKLLPPTKSN